MDDILCKAAHEHGVLVSVASDAHSGAELSQLAAGIRQARRGWLGAKDVLNARLRMRRGPPVGCELGVFRCCTGCWLAIR
jgi:histidinol phosphatase-like PHP family hydrolase